ncbi:MAG TPA: O-antigen ligase family protein, partial [Candidatus Goldiibacteriota bacterium]|nr:O-antigen ligase family protein [Candidatus Goldiibacteriota bacterium]
MKEKVFRIFDVSAISILCITLISSLIYPPYRNFYSIIVYVLFISFSTFLYIIRYKFSKEVAYNETPVDNLLFLFFIWHIISTMFATNKIVSLNTTVIFSVLLAFYYVIHNYAKIFYKNILWILFSVAAVLSIYGIYQYFFGFNYTLNYLYSNPAEISSDIISRLKSNRIFSTFIYPNTFAGFLIMIIPVAIGFTKNEKKYRIFLVPLLLLLTFALLLTKSVGAFISLILSMILIFFLVSDKSIKNFKSFLICFFLIILLIFIFVIKDRGIHDIISSFSAKYYSIIKMLRVSADYLLFGSGPGNFEEVYNAAGINKSGYLKYAHNIIMQTTIELGIPGIIILLLILFSQYKVILQNFFF